MQAKARETLPGFEHTFNKNKTEMSVFLINSAYFFSKQYHLIPEVND